MSLMWRSVSVVLLIEVIVLLALCAPLPWGVRKNISRWIFRVKARERLNSIIKYITFALFMALAESLNALRIVAERTREQNEGHLTQDPVYITPATDYRWKKVRAERNFYLASFSIITLVAITRLVRLAAIEVQLRQRIKSYNGNKPISETGETLEIRGKTD
ncbi:hypothetical protein BWQ96_02837 [Gracilariopsis chorda]|uniref:Endoplasmic reticulum transmembrane protein n=1 Tax=Gracilariopsis chorda TaxID=448386 RepID=A0A2V3J0A2_9FLOR|nr:hypothetical protein BWQ96_02837 [Gracilariopsis chorda]|eukprot:PXF47357.1 hypothetical protein BWQ96_02837 [Gracilariopsis chorda]